MEMSDNRMVKAVEDAEEAMEGSSLLGSNTMKEKQRIFENNSLLNVANYSFIYRRVIWLYNRR